MKYINSKNAFLIFLIFPYFAYSQIREINKIDNDINSQIEIVNKMEVKKKFISKKIDSLNGLRIQKYDELIKYFNENPNKQYYLNKADSLRKPESFRENFVKKINKNYLDSKPDKFSTVINFTLTPKGKLINVNAKGEDVKFNTLSIIALYKLLTEFEPFYKDKNKLLQKDQTFNLPITIDL